MCGGGQPCRRLRDEEGRLGLVAATKKETEEHDFRVALETELAELFWISLPLAGNLNSKPKIDLVAD